MRTLLLKKSDKAKNELIRRIDENFSRNNYQLLELVVKNKDKNNGIKKRLNGIKI